MKANEFATIASAIKAAWPNANVMPDSRSKDVWYTMLQDLDYAVCLNAVKQLMSTSRFVPSIAEIRECCAKTTSPELPEWGDAWGEVQRAIRNYGYCREEEALEGMEEQTRRCVKRIGWQNICMSDNPAADRANFRMMYEQEAKGQREALQLPQGVRQQRERFQMIAAETVKRLERKPASEELREPKDYTVYEGAAEELRRRWEQPGMEVHNDRDYKP